MSQSQNQITLAPMMLSESVQATILPNLKQTGQRGQAKRSKELAGEGHIYPERKWVAPGRVE